MISLPAWGLLRLLLVPLRGHCVKMPPNSFGVGVPDSSLLPSWGLATCWERKSSDTAVLGREGFISTQPARMCPRGPGGWRGAALRGLERLQPPSQRHPSGMCLPRGHVTAPCPPCPLPNGAQRWPHSCGAAATARSHGDRGALGPPVGSPGPSASVGDGDGCRSRLSIRLSVHLSRLWSGGRIRCPPMARAGAQPAAPGLGAASPFPIAAAQGGDRRVFPIPRASTACPGVLGRAGCGAGQLESGRSRSSARAGTGE